jgi:alkylation response protein AidB-like acyl-CoA dehydrogenase
MMLEATVDPRSLVRCVADDSLTDRLLDAGRSKRRGEHSCSSITPDRLDSATAGAVATFSNRVLGDTPADPLDAMLHGSHPRKLAARDWAREHGSTDASQPGSLIDRSMWRAAADAGIQSLIVPTEFGGAGRSAVDAMLTFEGLGLGASDNGLLFALSSQVFAMQRAFADSASAQQLEQWMPKLLAGEAFGCFAMSEPEAGSDISAISTVAVAQDTDGSYVLNGSKSWATLGPLCDVAIVFATTDPDKGRWGITAFVVDASTEGFVRGPAVAKMGLGSCPFGSLDLVDCRVGPESVLGRPGSGAAIFADAVEGERVFLYAAALGAMERVLDQTVERARTRRQSGKTIGSFQAVSHRIVDMKLRHEAARLLVYKAAALHDRGQSIALAAGLAKLQTSETSVQSALDAMRVFGATGYTVEAGLERELRDAVGGLAYSGTPDVTRNIVAGLLRLDRSGASAKTQQSEDRE